MRNIEGINGANDNGTAGGASEQHRFGFHAAKKGEMRDRGEIEGEGTELVSSVIASLWRKHGKISSRTKMERVTATVQCGDEYFSLLVPPVLSMSEVCAHHTVVETSSAMVPSYTGTTSSACSLNFRISLQPPGSVLMSNTFPLTLERN